MHSAFTSSSKNAVRLHLVSKDMLENWLNDQSAALKTYLSALGFKADTGAVALAPDADGNVCDAVVGMGSAADALSSAYAAAKLPAGSYEIASKPKSLTDEMVHAGWADGAYKFDRYLKTKSDVPKLVITSKSAAGRANIIADGIDYLRDLINTPAQDMGPSQISASAKQLAETYGASFSEIVGDELLSENYPMIHAVGRAAADAPRYIEIKWDGSGDDKSAKTLALVGKGIAFDTGGLNIKTGNYMRLMKKDMGGAAHALGLARMIMAAGLNVKLNVHIPCAENAVGADAFRPSDILSSRKGLTVEIDNTDAEGRLVLADALTRASELSPDLILDFATLTGAARVAVGAELAPYFTDDDDLAKGIEDAAQSAGDPVWRMPLWTPYRAMLNSPVADIVNGASSPFAGSITAALFLKEFVDAPSWAHFDVWGWRNGKYGRPEGGAAFAVRALFQLIEKSLGR